MSQMCYYTFAVNSDILISCMYKLVFYKMYRWALKLVVHPLHGLSMPSHYVPSVLTLSPPVSLLIILVFPYIYIYTDHVFVIFCTLHITYISITIGQYITTLYIYINITIIIIE